MADTKRLMSYRFEVGRALRTAHMLAGGEMQDTGVALRDLARAVTSLAQALDDLLEMQEPEEVARAG